jgi:hypothetical protein
MHNIPVFSITEMSIMNHSTLKITLLRIKIISVERNIKSMYILVGLKFYKTSFILASIYVGMYYIPDARATR